MAGETISTNMGMPIPAVGVTAGPTWASDVNASLTILDQHTHVTGSGVPITPSAMNINSDLSFGSNSALAFLKTGFTSQSAALSGTNFLSFVGGNLYVNDGSGNQIPITSGGGVAGSPGSIGSLTSPASATYSAGSKKFTWASGSSKAAAMDNGAVIIRETDVASAKGVTLASPSGLAADYQITLLTALPASTQVVNVSSSGSMGTLSYDSVGSSMTSVGANAVAATMTSTGANAIAATMTSTGTTSILNTAGQWTAFTPTLQIDSGGGTLVSSTTNTARYLLWGKLLFIEMEIVLINISGSPSNLKFTAPATILKQVKIPIWTQATLTSAIGRIATTAASAVIKVGSGIDGGNFPVSTTSEFNFCVALETT